MKKIITIFAILASFSAYAANYEFTRIIEDDFTTSGPNNLLNGSHPDTIYTTGTWNAATAYQRSGGVDGYVHLSNTNVPTNGDFAFIDIPNSGNNQVFVKNNAYALSASMAVYAQGTRTGYACIGYRTTDTSTVPSGLNPLPLLWIDENGNLGIQSGSGVSNQISLSQFVPGFQAGITPVNLEYFTLLITTDTTQWVASAYYNDTKVTFSDGSDFSIVLSASAQSILENQGSSGNNLYVFLNTNLDATKKGTALESGFDTVLLQEGRPIPESSTYALALGLTALCIFVLRGVKNR